MDEERIEIGTVTDSEDSLPTYATKDAAGADLKANLKQPLVIQPGDRALIPTGIRVAIPVGYEIQIRPRSGLALKHGITVLNSPGTIDADYRGEVGVILCNLGKEPFTVTHGMRIAQAVVAKVALAEYVLYEELVETARGERGFGHTGS